jgi:hypothetical protein
MATTLNALGIPAAPASMKICTNASATRANIIAGIKWLVTGAKKGDVIVFYYSGHGSQVVDLNKDEIDKKDETICPHDYAAAGMIKDDDLRSLFAGLAAGVNLDVILDSCHSGTGTREMAALAAVPVDEQVTYRYIEPSIDYGFFLDANPQIPTQGILKPVLTMFCGPDAAITRLPVRAISAVSYAVILPIAFVRSSGAGARVLPVEKSMRSLLPILPK